MALRRSSLLAVQPRGAFALDRLSTPRPTRGLPASCAVVIRRRLARSARSTGSEGPALRVVWREKVLSATGSAERVLRWERWV